MMRTVVAAAALASLGGCAFVPFRHHHARAPTERLPETPPVAVVETPRAPPVTGACRTDLLRVLERRPGSAVVAAQALDLSGARTIRWMRPGDIVTMDFRPDRLTIKLTRANIVKSFACG